MKRGVIVIGTGTNSPLHSLYLAIWEENGSKCVYYAYNTHYAQAIIVVFWIGYLDADIMLKLHVIIIISLVLLLLLLYSSDTFAQVKPFEPNTALSYVTPNVTQKQSEASNFCELFIKLCFCCKILLFSLSCVKFLSLFYSSVFWNDW